MNRIPQLSLPGRAEEPESEIILTDQELIALQGLIKAMEPIQELNAKAQYRVMRYFSERFRETSAAFSDLYEHTPSPINTPTPTTMSEPIKSADIESFIDRYQPAFEIGPDGVGKATIKTIQGLPIEFFTCSDANDYKAAAFTKLECYFMGRNYYIRLPRSYHPRWWSRLAETFACHVMNQANGK